VVEARFCLRCGTRMEPRMDGDRERMVCPACGYVHYVNPIVAAGCLVLDDGRALLVRRSVEPARGKWGLPSGYGEAGERPEETAVRETFEETGLRVEITDLIGVYSFLVDTVPGGVVVFYAARPTGGALRPGDDASEVRFFAPEELPAELAFRPQRRILGQWARAATIRCQEADAEQRARVAELAGQQGITYGPAEGRAALAACPLLLVALEGAEVVGFLAADDAPLNGTLALRGVYVLPDYRRWGIGTRLLGAASVLAAQRGADALLAEVPAENPALLLFTHAGFRVTAVRPEGDAGTLVLTRAVSGQP